MHAAFPALLNWLAGVLVLLFAAYAGAAPLSTAVEHDAPVGRSATFLQEPGARFELADAVAAFSAGRGSPGRTPVLTFGIGARPVWIRLEIANPAAEPASRRLSIEMSWLDQVEVYIVHHGTVAATHHAGDRLPFMQRTVMGRGFLFDHAYPPGASEVFIRVETPDPMVLPIHFESREGSRLRHMQQELSYGLVYGFLLALIAYNAILYASLRASSYLSYALYLLAFIAMNVAYTGHGFAWLWPEAVGWQRWANPLLMTLYAVSGLLFAIRFLDLRANFPRIRRAVLAYCAAGIALLGGAVLLGRQEPALLVAFGFVLLFTLMMPALGIIAVRAGQRSARYFLLAAGAGMAGAVLTTLAIWGLIPYSDWAYRAVEVGMLADATLLALALAYRFRASQEARLRAERLAQLDLLTGINNRRAFHEQAGPLWSNAIRHRHPVSVMMVDIDYFKRVNDTYGHAHGDVVLKMLAAVLREHVREADVLARWGGEEFIVLLPETAIDDAIVLAERLREAVAAMRIPRETGQTAITASFGVAERDGSHGDLDALIASADACLYQSKRDGRNRVTGRPPGAGCTPHAAGVAGA